jgi:arginine repressor
VLAISVTSVKLSPSLLVLLGSMDVLQLVGELMDHLQLPSALATIVGDQGLVLTLLGCKRGLRDKVDDV